LLRDANWESIHWSTVGRADASDSEIMAYAARNGYVVLTNDLDFAAILAATNLEKPSVAQIRAADLSTETIGKQIVAALRQAQAELERGALLTIESDRARLRILPFPED